MNFARVPLVGRLSLVLLGLFVLVAIFADLIANPAPLLLRHDGSWSVLPSLSASRSEAIAGGATSPGDWALWAPVRASSDPTGAVAGRVTRSTSGSEATGRDVLAATIRGTRTLVVASVAMIAFALVFGAALGWHAAFGSAFWDAALARLVEAIGVFPTPVLVALAVLATPNHRYAMLVAVVGMLRALEIARLLRADLLIRERDPSLDAHRLLALPDRRRLARWMTRCAPAMLLSAAFAATTLVGVDAGLTWVGLPVDPFTPSWGALLGAHGLPGRWLPALGIVLFTGSLFVLADSARRLHRTIPATGADGGLAVPPERST